MPSAIRKNGIIGSLDCWVQRPNNPPIRFVNCPKGLLEKILMPDINQNEINKLVDHLFRRTAGQLVATLTRIFGPGNIDLAESVVQEAFLKACLTWPYNGIPDNPAAWLTTVAKNYALNLIKKETIARQKEAEILAWYKSQNTQDDNRNGIDDPTLVDDQLRLMFLCCDPSLSKKAQICLTLKTVGGFSAGEIARAFLSNEEATRKLITRAKQTIRAQNFTFVLPEPEALSGRVDAVLEVLYLIFNEGYSAYEGKELVREDLCDEAIRLTSLFLHEAFSHFPKLPVVKALLALMLLHSSRLPARTDAEGNLIVLADQDRALWDKARIIRGLKYLNESAAGDEISVYHLEAHIAACHALAPSYEESDWRQILADYDDLLVLNPNPVIALNRAVAVGMLQGPDAGLAALQTLADDPKLEHYYLLPAAFADFYRRLHDRPKAITFYKKALTLAGTQAEKLFLEKQIAECSR